jgi:hypothetical protein
LEREIDASQIYVWADNIDFESKLALLASKKENIEKQLPLVKSKRQEETG